MQAGNLRHSVTLQRRSTTKGAMGGKKDSWSTLATVYAAIRPVSGREFDAAKMANSKRTHEVRIRSYSGLTTSDRILFGSRVFNIESILNVDERDREMIIRCWEDAG